MESRERYFEGKQSAISEDELALQVGAGSCLDSL